jgi:hypothetical protein
MKRTTGGLGDAPRGTTKTAAMIADVLSKAAMPIMYRFGLGSERDDS